MLYGWRRELGEIKIFTPYTKLVLYAINVTLASIHERIVCAMNEVVID